MMGKTLGRVNSFQSLGAVDGPGIRFVVFLQGCNLRCGVCHNPDTWDITLGKEYSAAEIIKKAVRYREYFGEEGGITVSGGEPLLQADFVYELFSLAKEAGINTCLDTSGSIINPSVISLLSVTDRVLLDIKYVTDELYRKFVGCPIDRPLEFLKLLSESNIPTVIRQVTVPGINADAESVISLKKLVRPYPCVEKIELLPFKKLCRAKYERLSLPFEFDKYPEPSAKIMSELEECLK